LNGNQVQQVSEESLNFERAPLKLQRAIKSAPNQNEREREREREREKEEKEEGGGEGGVMMQPVKKTGAVSVFWAEVLMDRKKYSGIGQLGMFFLGSSISIGHSTGWTGLGNLAILTWRCGIGGLEMRTWQLDLIIEQCGVSHLQSELEKQVK